jgi:hypothetical protein
MLNFIKVSYPKIYGRKFIIKKNWNGALLGPSAMYQRKPFGCILEAQLPPQIISRVEIRRGNPQTQFLII